jgi:RNA polymerase sigma factor (TIGR02999 family)
MPEATRSEITQILLGMKPEGLRDPAAGDRLLKALYPELRRLAASLMRRERADHTLQATALVHEAYMKLVDPSRASWESRAHFLGVAARAMRQILVDHARARAAVKRGGGWQRITLDTGLGSDPDREVAVLALHDALGRLAAVDPRAARGVELRVFGGLTVEETAHVLCVSKRTVDSDWAMARLWLARELGGETEGAAP